MAPFLSVKIDVQSLKLWYNYFKCISILRGCQMFTSKDLVPGQALVLRNGSIVVINSVESDVKDRIIVFGWDLKTEVVGGQITLQLDLNLNQYSTYKDQDVCYVFSVKYMSLHLIKACLSNKEYLGNSVKNPNENLFFVWSRDTPK